MVQSALLSAAARRGDRAAAHRIILSAKVSAVQDLIAVYRISRARSDYALHLGLTEAGMGSKGIVASSAAMGILLQQGIGDTIRISLTPEPNGDRTRRGEGRAGAAADHGLPHLRAAGRGLSGLRPHDLDDVPGTRQGHPGLHPRLDAGVEDALSGRRGADRRGDGLHRQRAGRVASTPTSASRCRAPASSPPRRCSSTARRSVTLRGPTVAADFKQMVIDYIERRYGVGGVGRTAAE